MSDFELIEAIFERLERENAAHVMEIERLKDELKAAQARIAQLEKATLFDCPHCGARMRTALKGDS